MTILFGVALVVALWWALSAKRNSQAALRYQVHRDALANAERILADYSYSARERESGGWEFHFDVRHAPLELRDSLHSALDGVLSAVKFTNIPKDLGDPERLESLLSDLDWVRRIEHGEIAGERLRKLRARFVDSAFNAIDEDLKFLQRHDHFPCDRLAFSLRDAQVALTWKIDGHTLTRKEAKRLALQAQEFLRAHDYEIKVARGSHLHVLASKQSPSGIAVDAMNVYWTNNSGTVMRVRKDGGQAKVIASRQENPYGIAVSSNYACWTTLEPPDFENGSVVGVSLPGGALTTLACERSGSFAITIDAEYLYCASNEEGTIVKLPLGGGRPIVVVSGQARPRRTKVDTLHLYWVNWGDAAWPSKFDDASQSSFRDSCVMKASLAGGTPVALATGQAKPDCLQVNATHAFWTCSLDGTVTKVPLTGGEACVVAADQERPGELAVDGESMYWINDGRAVMKAPIGGGEPILVASSGARGPSIHGLVIDDTNLYFWDADGNLMSLAKE